MFSHFYNSSVLLIVLGVLSFQQQSFLLDIMHHINTLYLMSVAVNLSVFCWKKSCELLTNGYGIIKVI